MRKFLVRGCVAVLVGSFAVAQAQSHVAQLEKTFQSPPDSARVMMRWWWFGSAVTKPELLRELEQMKAGGFGGFEIQPVYPLALDDPRTGFRNLPYLSPEFLDDVRYVNEEAHRLGLRANLTLSSGWPYGGPHTPITEASAKIRQVRTAVNSGETSVAVPALSNGEKLLAVFSIRKASTPKLLPLPAAGATRMNVPPDAYELAWYIVSRTGQQVKRPAVDGNGFVLDHFSHQAVADHLHNVADKLLAAFGNQPPYSVFSDSLEVYGADWTPGFLQEFRKHRGYDLLPYLPDLFTPTPDAQALAVRHDWGVTLTELIDQNYLSQITAWAHAHHTLFRSQTYGSPAVSLSSNSLVDLPEGEGPQWRRFSFTRWATSASHVYGRPITSSETWTWLHSPAFRATPLDMKQEADRFFLQGINQLMGHGWPYSPPSAGGPGWRFYAAGAFNTHNPWWIVMPDVTRYLQRVSWALRQGKPANQVAIYLPEDDAWAAFTPGRVAMTDVMPRWITPALTQAVEDAGYNFDYIDAAAIAARGIHYPVLILPNVDRISPDTLARIAQYIREGGKVIAVGRVPAHAPGLVNYKAITSQVEQAARAMFDSADKNARMVADAAQLADALHALVLPDMRLTPAANQVGFIRRSLPHADLYFIANTGNTPVRAKVHLGSKYSSGEWLNPDTGAIRAARSENGQFSLALAPYGSAFLLLHADSATGAPEQTATSHEMLIADLSKSWRVSFGDAKKETMPQLVSWTRNEKTRYYSGVAIYSKTFDLPAGANHDAQLILSFGKGAPVALPTGRTDESHTQAWFDPPIRAAAVVYVNGKRAGSLWHPPYELEITALLKPGQNRIDIHVANTAINELAGQSMPNYRLLWARYGRRFVPQDMDHLKPIPSGLLGEVELLRRSKQ